MTTSEKTNQAQAYKLTAGAPCTLGDLGAGDLFRMNGRTYLCRGCNHPEDGMWYGSPEGYDGGPWFLDDPRFPVEYVGTQAGDESAAHKRQAVHVDRKNPAVCRILEIACPGYKGNRVTIETASSVEFDGTMWAEGTRYVYSIVRYDGRTTSIPTEPYGRSSQLHDSTYQLKPGYAVTRWTQGSRYSAVTILVHPDMVPRFLPTPNEAAPLDRDSLIVLVATKSLKSSYGGIKNYRFHEAQQDTGITLAQWDTAKAALIERRLLSKAGAITNAGRNVLEASGNGMRSLFDLRTAA